MSDSNLRIGCFRVLSDLKSGVGSQGAVYKAVCEREGFEGVVPGSVVALKVMTVHDVGNRLFARLQERTAELSRINHPNVVRYLGCFRETTPFNDLHVVVLEYLEGESLKDLLSRFPSGLDADEALRIGGRVIAGLTHICSLGMVHRDVKPGNIFLCRDGGVKLIDFEVARQENGGTTATGGNLIGTFDYMAPDFTMADFRGDEVSDVFSFGVCLHETLTGHTPYRRQPGEDSQASFAFLSRWSRTEDWVCPVKISGRVNKVLSGASEVITAALCPERENRIRSFADLSREFGRIRFRELSHGGDTWRLLLYAGRGGFGEVFKARDMRTGRTVAIKHLLKSGYADRFRREAKLMAKLSDSCFAKFRAFFEIRIGGAESAFIVMDYLDGMPGRSLRDEIKAAGGEPLPREAVLAAFVRYAHGLAALHAKGLIHRDIKPSNLYFPKDAAGKAAIMDFGVARDVSGTATVGNVPGTLDYMPPEVVIEGSRGDSGMDIYALGLSLYEALSGKPAYPRLPDGSAGYRMFFERAKNKIPPKLDSSVCRDIPRLETLIREMTDPDPLKRLKDARAVERCLSGLCGEVRVSGDERASDGFLACDGDGAEPEDQETLATVPPDKAALERLAREVSGVKRGKRLLLAALTATAVVCLSAGGRFVYRSMERSRIERIERGRMERERLAEMKRQEEAEARRKAEEERVMRERKEAEDRKLEEERRRKAEAQKKALDEALRRVEAERLAREAAERKAAAEAEEARKAEELAAKLKAQAEAKRKAEIDAARRAAEENARRKLAAEAEKKRAAEAEAARKAAELAKARARAEAERKAKSDSVRKAAELKAASAKKAPSPKAEALKKLARAKAELDAYKVEYERKRAEALRPGSRENPNDLDREWYTRLRRYRQLKKKIESMND